MAIQVASGFVLLIGGILTVASLGAALNSEPGYSADRMILLEASVRKYVSADDARQQLEESVSLLQRMPGIDNVAVSTIQANFLRPLVIPTHLTPEGWAQPVETASVRHVSENFFKVMGVRLVDGEWPRSGEWDNTGAALVSVSAARSFWPKGQVVGRTLQLEDEVEAPAYTVVGVVADARFAGLDISPSQEVYLPNAIVLRRTGLLYHIRTLESPDTSLPVVLRELSAKGIRVDRSATHSAGLFESVKDRALPAWLFGLMGVSALMILAIGLGGLLAMVSARRTQEVGIRLALGSTRAQVVRVLLKEPAESVLDGLVIGALASWWLVTFLDSQLYGIRSHHPGLWAIAIVTMMAVSIVAAALPAIRATRVNPVDTLRAL